MGSSAPVKDASHVEFGDTPGHPFHGNQYTTRNEGYGYHGTIALSTGMKTTAAREFDRAAKALIQYQKMAPQAAVDYLDSVYGRHLADRILDRQDMGVEKVIKGPHATRDVRNFMRTYKPEDYGKNYSLARLLEDEVHFGDTPGHPFRGNQYTHLQLAPGVKDESVYTQTEKRRGWNGEVAPHQVGGMAGGGMLANRMPEFTKSMHQAAAEHYDREADRLKAAWSKTADEAAMATFGRKFALGDYRISAIGSDQFSESHKNALRGAAHGMTIARDRASLHRNAVRYASMSAPPKDYTVDEDEQLSIEVYATMKSTTKGKCSSCGTETDVAEVKGKPYCKDHMPDEKYSVAEFAQSIKGIEIFGTGNHNGDEYTENDIDEIINSFQNLDFRPALKVGHSKDTPGAPAYGWVQNLRKEKTGDQTKLVADFTDMDDSVVDALRTRKYDRVSSEIYFNLQRGGKKYKRALKAVALLGAEVPAVAGLKPLHKMEFSESGFDSVATPSVYTLAITQNAFYEALHERTERLNLYMETNMGKNAAEIKSLKAQVSELEGKLAALAGKESTEEFKALDTQVKQFSTKIAALEAADVADAGIRKDLAEAQSALKAAAEREKQTADRLAKLEQKERDGRIGDKVRACKIPAMRSALGGLYAYAIEHPDVTVKVFSKDDDGKDVSKDTGLSELVDSFVGVANEMSEKLFKALAVAGQGREAAAQDDDNASAQVERKVKEYRAKHTDVKSYEVALKAVLAADPELAKAYRSQFSGTEQ